MNELTCGLCIQSNVCAGYVGNRNAIFILQSLGIEVDSLDTVYFSNHTGYRNFSGKAMDSDNFKNLFQKLNENNLLRYDFVFTGYMPSVEILLETLNIIKLLKERNPNILFICDPVLGDLGRLYVPEELIHIYSNQVIQFADIITPNQFECELLSNMKIDSEEKAWDALNELQSKGAKIVIASSLDTNKEKKITLLSSGNKQLEIESRALPQHFTGTGDCFTALITGYYYKFNGDLNQMVVNAINAMQSILQKTVEISKLKEKKFPNMHERGKLELAIVQAREYFINPLDSNAKIIQDVTK